MVTRQRSRKARFLTKLGIALAGMGAAWWSFAVTARQVLEPVYPSIGLLGSVSTAGQADAAAQLASPQATDAERRKASAMALAVLQREPGNVVAARTLGLIAGARGQESVFNRWLAYGESLSRRDTPTQFALIEERVAADDIPGALLHYNRAMLVNVSSRDTLLPVLVPAAEDMDIARALVPFLRRRPLWWTHFVQVLNGGGTNPATISLLLQALRLNVREPSEAASLGEGLQRMIALGDYDGAFAFYRSLRKAPPGLLRDGDFHRTDAFGPFEWSLSDGEGGSATLQERSDGRGLALFISAGDTDADVASQTLLLPPGNYRLTAKIVADTASSPPMTVRIQCVATRTELTRITSATSDAAGSQLDTAFRAPQNCRIFKILISVAAATEGQAAGWVDDIALTRLQ